MEKRAVEMIYCPLSTSVMIFYWVLYFILNMAVMIPICAVYSIKSISIRQFPPILVGNEIKLS